MNHRHPNYEVCNGHIIYLSHVIESHEPEDKRLTTWESIVFVAEKAYDARDIGGLAFDGTVIVILRRDVPVPILFLIGGILLGLYLLRIQSRLKH